MRIIPFPSGEPLPGQEAWTAELEAALRGDSQGPAANAWRELRDDVRSLAPPMTPAFEARLAEELERRGALPPRRVGADAGDTPETPPRRFARLRLARRSLASHRRPALGAATAAATALVAVLLISGSHGSRPTPAEKVSAGAETAIGRGFKGPVQSELGPTPSSSSARVRGEKSEDLRAAPSQAASSAAAKEFSAATALPSSAGPASAPGRVQQLGASVTLGTTPAAVQEISDQVAQLTVREGGYVQTSDVQVQQQGASQATLALRLPSARLSAALASIGRLAPVRAESQSLQDITGSYNAARQQLSDTEAEQRALLRALAAATTEGQIDSLHERLAQSRAAITRAQASLNAVSQRASTAEVEVSVLGDARAGDEGLTLHSGLHDVGRVLLVALIAILILFAVLVPLALVIGVLAGARRLWRRYQRERVLNAP
jgi:hypothetical protein